MEKTCTKCKQAKPLEAFTRLTATKDGYNWQCRDCLAAYRTAWQEEGRKAIPDSKACRCCGETKDLQQFGKDRYSKDGLSARCKPCLAMRDRERRAKQDPDLRRQGYRESDLRRRESRQEYRARPDVKARRNAYNREWAKKNPELYRAKFRRYEIANRGKINEWAAAYRKKRPDYFRKKRREWELKYPEKYRASRIARMERRRAREKAAPGDYRPADIRAMLIEQEGRCYACEVDIREDYTIDHIYPLALGGTNHLSNIQLLCQSCNSSKGGKDPAQWSRESGKRVKGITIQHEQVC